MPPFLSLLMTFGIFAYVDIPLNPANQNLTVGILSYDGRVCFGLLSDRDLDPPVTEAAAALEDALAELTA